MNSTDIKKIFDSLIQLQQEFQSKNYHLTSLDKGVTRRLIEELYLALLESNHVAPSESTDNSAVITFSAPENLLDRDERETIDDVNDEIDQFFTALSPQETEDKKVVINRSLENEINQPSSQMPFKLGINERLMFAKALFDDNMQRLEESIRQLKSFEDMEAANRFFDEKLEPFLLSEGRDEEIIDEYRLLVSRLYSK